MSDEERYSLTPEGLDMYSQMMGLEMDRMGELLSQKGVNLDGIPEPRRTLILKVMVDLKLESEKKGRYQTIYSLRDSYIDDPDKNAHYRRVLEESYPYAICTFCNDVPTHYEKGGPESACESHTVFLSDPSPYLGVVRYDDI